MSGHTILHFMWGYQPHYRASVEEKAKSVLRKLDENLYPEVILAGVLADGETGNYPACVEPEQDWWVESEAFDEVVRISESLRPGYPESRLMHSHPIVQARHEEMLVRKSIRDAILQVIDGHPARPPGRTFFASLPESVNGYFVTAVMSVATALRSVLPLSSRMTTVEYKVNLLKPVPDGVITAHGSVIRLGKTIAVGSTEIRNEKEEPVAFGSATYYILNIRAPEDSPGIMVGMKSRKGALRKKR